MKRFLSILLCIVLVLSSTAAFAESEKELQVFGYNWTQDNSELDVLMYAKAGNVLSAQDFSAKLDEVSLTPKSLRPYKGSAYGTSWIVIVEPDSSDTEKKAISNIVEALYTMRGTGDTVSILDAGTCELFDFVDSSAAAKTLVKSANESANKIRLYDAIAKALSSFQTNSKYNEHKCLLILTRSQSQESAYISLEMLEKEAEEQSVTIYTVGFNRQNATLQERFAELSRLSARSASGLAIPVDTKEVNTSDIMFQISGNEENFVVLSLSYDTPVPREEGSLLVTLNVGSVKLDSRFEHVQVPKSEACEHEWLDATCTSPKRCSKCGETEGAPLGHNYSDGGFFKRATCDRCGDTLPSGWDLAIEWAGNNVLVIVLGVVLLALLVVLAIILLKQKKPEELETDGPETSPVKLTVELTNRKTGEVVKGRIFDKTLLAGRQAAMEITGDPAISKEHLEFLWESGILYVSDHNSKNGTIINGQDIRGKGPLPLSHNDILHIGNSDFIVHWHFGE